MIGALGCLAASAIVAALGGATARFRGEDAASAWLVRVFVTGALGLHLLLALLGSVGVAWSFGAVAAPAAFAALAWRRCGWRGGRFALERPGVGDLVAAGVLALFAWRVLSYDAVTPDFYYHWGLKARRFLFAGGVDLEFLLGPGAWRYHAEYPCLWGDLLLAPGLAIGRFSVRAALAWSIAVFALVLLVARRALVDAAPRPWLGQALVAAFALLVGSFSLVHLLGGQADWLMAFALVVATPALIEPRRPTSLRELVLAAALAAASKVEGAPLAGWLLAGALLPRLPLAVVRSTLPRLTWRETILATVPAAVSAAIWLVPVWRWKLDRSSSIGGYRWERCEAALRAIGHELSTGAQGWGPTLLVLLAIPALIVARRTRVFGLVVLAQAATYLFAYSGGAADVAVWVATSLPRLLFHLVPALLLACGLGLARWSRGEVAASGAETRA